MSRIDAKRGSASRMNYRLTTKCGICHKDTLAQFACVKCGMTLCESHVVKDEAGITYCPFCAAGRSPETAKLLKILAVLGAILLIILEMASPQLIRAIRKFIESMRRGERR